MIARHSTEFFQVLDDFIGARRELPFAWGSQDCCNFAADWVQLVRGVDPMADLRGLNSGLEANRALVAAGGLLAAVTQRMGPPIVGKMAQVGDVALVRHSAGLLSMGVCLGPYVTAPGVAGLLMLPITHAEAAWRV